MDQEHSHLRTCALNGPSPWHSFSHLSIHRTECFIFFILSLRCHHLSETYLDLAISDCHSKHPPSQDSKSPFLFFLLFQGSITFKVYNLLGFLLTVSLCPIRISYLRAGIFVPHCIQRVQISTCPIIDTQCILVIKLSSVQFSCSVVSNSLQPQEWHHARPPCPSLTPGVHSNSCSPSW